jgi:hypothetical protein
MSNNLFVSFQLSDSQRSSALTLAAVEELGSSVPVFRTLWYVRSNLSAAEAAARLRAVLDDRDRLVVIDTSRNEIAMLNIDERACAVLDVQWHREIAISASRAEAAARLRNSA